MVKLKPLSARLVATYIILGIGVVILVMPFLWAVTTSFKPKTEVFKFPPTLLPEDFTLGNYVTAWTTAPFGRFFLNSVIISVIVVSVVMCLITLAAFSFARLQFKGKNVLFLLLMTSLISPGIATLIPNFMIVKGLNLLDTYPGIFLPYIGWNIAMNLLILRGFFHAIPSSIEDAARLDKCSTFKIFYKIDLPFVKNGIATLAIFLWLFCWDEFMWVLTVTSSESLRTMPVGISLFAGQYITEWPLLCSAIMINVLPPILFFVFMQRYFIPTAAFEAFKG